MDKYCYWPRKKMVSRRSKKKSATPEYLWKTTKRLIALTAILASGYGLFFSDFFEVKDITMSGNSLVKSAEAENFLFSKISQARIYPLVKGDMLLTSAEFLERSLREKFNIIKNIRIKKSFPDKLEVSLEEKNINAIWCRVSCFWLDNEGAVFEPFKEKEKDKFGIKNYLMILDNENSPLKEGDKITDKNFLDFAEIVRQALKEEIGLDFDNIKTPGVVTDEIWIQTRENWQIFFNVEGNAEDEVRLLKQILKEKITPEEKKNLEYIDLRIKGKVFYRIKK